MVCFDLFHSQFVVKKKVLPTPVNTRKLGGRGAMRNSDESALVPSPRPGKLRRLIPSAGARGDVSADIATANSNGRPPVPPRVSLFRKKPAMDAGAETGKGTVAELHDSRGVASALLQLQEDPQMPPVAGAGELRRGTRSTATAPSAGTEIEAPERALTAAVKRGAPQGQLALLASSSKKRQTKRTKVCVSTRRRSTPSRLPYFEAQVGMRCGIHAINNALQWKAISITDFNKLLVGKYASVSERERSRRQMVTLGLEEEDVVALLLKAAPLLDPADVVRGYCSVDAESVSTSRVVSGVAAGTHEVIGNSLGSDEVSMPEIIAKLYTAVTEGRGCGFRHVRTCADLDCVIFLVRRHYIATIRSGTDTADVWLKLDSTESQKCGRPWAKDELVETLRAASRVFAWSSAAARQGMSATAPKSQGALLEQGLSTLLRGVDLQKSHQQKLWHLLGVDYVDPRSSSCEVHVGGCRVTAEDIPGLIPTCRLNDEVCVSVRSFRSEWH